MGWAIYLETDRIVAREDADAIVASLPKNLCSVFQPDEPPPFSRWGWSAATDIDLPAPADEHHTKPYWRIGGSYDQSGHIAHTMALFLAEALRARNYVVHVDHKDFQ